MTTATTLGQGRLLVLTGDSQGLQGQTLREVDLAGNLVREISVEHVRVQLEGAINAVQEPDIRLGSFDHEAIRIANGHLLAQVSAESLLPIGEDGDDRDTVAGLVVDLGIGGEVLWHWSPFAEPDLPKDPAGATCESNAPGCPPLFLDGDAYDWTHGNAIAYSPRDGNLIYSMRHLDRVVKLDYRNGAGTGGILWSLGDPPEPEGEDQTFDPEWFSHQHGASYIHSDDCGTGRIALLDNGNARCGDGDPDCHSRGQIWQVMDRVAGESGALTGVLSEVSLDLGAYSPALGMAQELSAPPEAQILHFTLGALTKVCPRDAAQEDDPMCHAYGPGPVSYGESLEIGAGGGEPFRLWLPGTLYRSYRMADLYGAGASGAGYATDPLLCNGNATVNPH
jgi:hypothetical protein